MQNVSINIAAVFRESHQTFVCDKFPHLYHRKNVWVPFQIIQLLSSRHSITLIGARQTAKAANSRSGVNLFHWLSGPEGEVLKERGEHNKEFHSGQSFTQTGPLPCAKQRSQRQECYNDLFYFSMLMLDVTLN